MSSEESEDYDVEMPPLPNNTVESPARPQIATIESLPKQRNSLPTSPTLNNSPTSLLNNNNNSSPTNVRNNSRNSGSGMLSTTLNNSSGNLLNNSGSSNARDCGGILSTLNNSGTNVRNNGMMSTTTTFETSGQSGTSTSNGGVLHEILDTTNFNREIERLKTFEGWRVPFLSAAQMAEAGFYYTKKDDIVRCAFCGVEVGSWVEGDNPMVDHQRWSPACRFLRKLPVGNVPLTAGEMPGGSGRTPSEGYDTCGNNATRQYGIVLREGAEAAEALRAGGSPGGSSCAAPLAIEKLGIQQMRPPAYPMFATNEARLASFAMWPISLKLKPNVFSEAGFFYTGKGDQTICYYCGGGLKDWEESDVPWEEHAKWFNRCHYVLSIKGKQFVDKVCNKKSQQDETAIQTEQTESESAPLSTEPRNESEPSTTTSTSVQPSSASSSVASNAASNVESAASPTADSRLCKICYMEEMGILFLPCGHIVACPKCALLLTTCAVCRKPYSATVRAFLS
ncbi:death-associated inhibitor of apoptosis 1 isoform X2 [Nilaparvata lugens]|uniref:death-associated inhibitor of apoptosis 1 isoform X2 n=1 Tax=Nilaparvata lugens TaxID=108931 RepID=UPI00193C8CEE|nr:death-associated inhibitor of apoptosis 1 isoform X2 [Nilaparvata lugens]